MLAMGCQLDGWYPQSDHLERSNLKIGVALRERFLDRMANKRESDTLAIIIIIFALIIVVGLVHSAMKFTALFRYVCGF